MRCNMAKLYQILDDRDERWPNVTFISIAHEKLKSGNDTSRHLVLKHFLDRPKMCQSQVRHLFMNLCTYLQGLDTPPTYIRSAIIYWLRLSLNIHNRNKCMYDD